ncbi:MAG: hydrolase [Arcobacter sp.]|nr:MAG: hydrolase [Arcobacter sp.]
MIKDLTILFDLDGTVIDSTEAILESFHNSFDVHKLPQPSDDDIKALIGHPLDVMYTDLRVGESLVWDMVKTYKEHYATIYKDKTVLLEHAVESIRMAQEIARLGVVTTKTGSFSRDLLEHFGVMDAFEVLIGREHVDKPKPNAEPINKAIAAMKADKSKTWMIGDTCLDIGSAQNAGVKSVAVLTGYDTREELNSLTNIIEDNVLEAVIYISKY